MERQPRRTKIAPVEQTEPPIEVDVTPGGLAALNLRDLSRAIDEHPLLFPWQEVILAQIINGEPINKSLIEDEKWMKKFEEMTPEEVKKFFALSNLRLLISVSNRYPKFKMGLPEAVQEGAIGLMVATTKYKHQKGNRFDTYAVWRIKQTVGRALSDNTRTIRIPRHLGDRMRRYVKIYEILRQETQQEFGRNPTNDEITKRTGMTPKALEGFMKYLYIQPISLEKLTASDEDDGDGRPLIDSVADPSVDVEATAMRNLELEKLRRVVSLLNQREREVLELYFGFNDNEPLTYNEIGKRCGVTGRAIQQRVKVAMAVLKSELAKIDKQALSKDKMA